jgi:hypothetical protein
MFTHAKNMIKATAIPRIPRHSVMLNCLLFKTGTRDHANRLPHHRLKRTMGNKNSDLVDLEVITLSEGANLFRLRSTLKFCT